MSADTGYNVAPGSGWGYEFLDTNRKVSGGFRSMPSTLTVRGDDPDRSAALVRAGMTVFANEMISVYGYYLGEFRGDRNSNGGSLGFACASDPAPSAWR